MSQAQLLLGPRTNITASFFSKSLLVTKRIEIEKLPRIRRFRFHSGSSKVQPTDLGTSKIYESRTEITDDMIGHIHSIFLVRPSFVTCGSNFRVAKVSDIFDTISFSYPINSPPDALTNLPIATHWAGPKQRSRLCLGRNRILMARL